ncbi:MAG: hypothetical protein ACK5NN_15650 [Sphingomonadaceae bacterium]
MEAIINAIIWLFEWLLPHSDPGIRRAQKIGYFLFGSAAIVIGGLVLLDVYGGR